MKMEKECADIVKYCNRMIERGLTRGTGGNISIVDRKLGLVAISPSAVEYEVMKPEDVAVVTLEGVQVSGKYAPSSEKDMHLGCYKNRDDIQAVVHTHSLYSTVLACLNEEIPAVHYLIGFAGKSVPCIPYELFGTEELAKSAVEGLKDNYAVLLGNHGLLAVGNNVDHAFNVAEQIEFVSEVYYKAINIRVPNYLNSNQMDEVIKKFGTYGKSQVAKY